MAALLTKGRLEGLIRPATSMSEDELLEKAAEAELLANEMKAIGDIHAARAFEAEAEAWLADAVALG